MFSRRSVISSGIAGLAAASAPSVLAQTRAKDREVIAIDDPRYARFFEARERFWSTLGPVDSDVIANIISPELMGGPAWPTTRQAYRIVRPAESLIIASDGLSDLFVDTNFPEAGFECEVYLESDELVGADFEALRSSWQFSLLENFAQNVADFGGLNSALDRYGVVSMELPAPANMPARWVTDHDSVGALINMTVPDRPTHCDLDEGVSIRLIPLTILLPDETDHVVDGGAAARVELAERLVASGAGLISSSNRASVLA